MTNSLLSTSLVLLSQTKLQNIRVIFSQMGLEEAPHHI